MKIVITIHCDNAPFEPNPEAEVARILVEFAHKLDNGDGIGLPIGKCPLRDLNGNIVGSAVVTG